MLDTLQQEQDASPEEIVSTDALDGLLEDKGFFRNTIDAMEVNVIIADKDTLNIIYVNPATVEALKPIQNLLPVPVSEIVGTCIDSFHKDPQFQRGILKDPNNLPHRADIQLGDEILALYVSAVNNSSGEYAAAMVTWSVVTEERAKEAEVTRLFQMVDKMPVNVLLADPKDLKITYANTTSIETLRGLQHLLPIPVDDLVGTCIDVFHKDPSVQRRILGDSNNLPFATNISLGDETLSLKVSAINDKDGNYILALLVWEIVTSEVAIAKSTREVADAVATSAGEMQAASSQLGGNIKDTRTRLTAVAAAAEQASANVNAVASAAEELSSATGEISRQVSESNRVTADATLEVEKAGELVGRLDEAGQKIGKVVSLINDIASQTNLLALNATIEAARAGDAGKGFAVVASEVKALATQTSGATEEITGQIESMQEATTKVVEAIKGISSTIETVNETASAISAAVEEQSAATKEIAENAQQVATGTAEVSKNTQGVETAMEEAAEGVTRMDGESSKLLNQSEELNVEIQKMLKQIGMDEESN